MKKLHKIKKLKLMSLRDWNVFRFPIWGKRLFESCSSSMDLSFGMCSSLEKASGVTSGAAILSRDIRVREWLSRVSPDLGKGFPNISRPRAWLSRTFPDLGNGIPDPLPTSGMAFPILSRPRGWPSRASADLGRERSLLGEGEADEARGFIAVRPASTLCASARSGCGRIWEYALSGSWQTFSWSVEIQTTFDQAVSKVVSAPRRRCQLAGGKGSCWLRQHSICLSHPTPIAAPSLQRLPLRSRPGSSFHGLYAV
jgi:hypothetical protein